MQYLLAVRGMCIDASQTLALREEGLVKPASATGATCTAFCLYRMALIFYYRKFREFGGIRHYFLEAPPTEKHNHKRPEATPLALNKRV